jgi:hypothetical protein
VLVRPITAPLSPCLPPTLNLPAGALSSTVFLDDAILIEKYLDDYAHTYSLDFADLSTRGALSVHINANRKGNGKRYDHWLDFDAGWCAPGWVALCGVRRG